MGEVYRAWDPQLQRWVALKFLHGSDPLQLARFQREARAQARVDHPGVCRVYEVGEVEGRPYIAMQEIDGADARPRRRASCRSRSACGWWRRSPRPCTPRTASGSSTATSSPSNILVADGEDGLHPFVVDFGLARDQRRHRPDRRAARSPARPATWRPEQARGDDAALDRRADVYSLGAMLYELLSGRLPLPAANLAEAIVKLLQEEPRAAARSWRRRCPPTSRRW